MAPVLQPLLSDKRVTAMEGSGGVRVEHALLADAGQVH